ncbi:hypothetical protein [Leptolyngbya sp. KIOST-1]|uniref:hypothetical protein n=1 Tax=Leptolyngbya sp. KIOST-1 TaxID=1229172 RepID=UPI00055F9D59|nr:hypothetical protein [Leptolyngbya sp. KIOST-1]
MVLNLAKSPLAISIGGVGAIAALVIGLSYLPSASDPGPEPELTLNNLTVSPWQQGIDLGWQAAVAAQSAQIEADWQRVSDLWGQAIAALESVPADAPNYAQAQAKAEEYRRNRAIAGDRLAAARAASPAVSDLQMALAAAQPGFSFAPGPNASTVGRSADGLASVELTSDRATLVLPRPQASAPLTMAQMVYAHQFVALTAPDVDQPWLLDSLRAAQSDRPLPPSPAAIALSTRPEALAITVGLDP